MKRTSSASERFESRGETKVARTFEIPSLATLALRALPPGQASQLELPESLLNSAGLPYPGKPTPVSLTGTSGVMGPSDYSAESVPASLPRYLVKRGNPGRFDPNWHKSWGYLQ